MFSQTEAALLKTQHRRLKMLQRITLYPIVARHIGQTNLSAFFPPGTLIP